MKKLDNNGRTFQINEDGSITIGLNREDCLESALQAWGEFTLSGGKAKKFGEWLGDELGKEREKRLLRELKEMEEKDGEKDKHK